MLFTFAKTAFISRALTVRMSSSSIKVTLVGAAGGIGQPLGLLLKKNTSIAHLALYDLVGTPGVAADLSHINTPSKVTEHLGPEQLAAALEGADVVIIPAGVPRKPGITRGDLFLTNPGIVRDVAEAFSKTCPKACHSTFPSACKVYKNNGCFNSGVPLVSKRAYCSSSSERERERERITSVSNMMRAQIFEKTTVYVVLMIGAAILLCFTIIFAFHNHSTSVNGSFQALVKDFHAHSTSVNKEIQEIRLGMNDLQHRVDDLKKVLTRKWIW